MTNTTAPKLPLNGDRLTWTSPMGTSVEVQNIGRGIYTVRKDGNLVEQFTTEEAARDLAREMSNIILRADRQRMEANQEAIKTATPYTTPETPKTPEIPKPTRFEDIKIKLGGIGQTRISTVAKGSLTKISDSQREALTNAVQYCGGRVYRGGALKTAPNGGKIALTLSQLYALEKRGLITLIEENFQVYGGLVTDSCRGILGLA
jgi:hypothetical protein